MISWQVKYSTPEKLKFTYFRLIFVAEKHAEHIKILAAFQRAGLPDPHLKLLSDTFVLHLKAARQGWETTPIVLCAIRTSTGLSRSCCELLNW